MAKFAILLVIPGFAELSSLAMTFDVGTPTVGPQSIVLPRYVDWLVTTPMLVGYVADVDGAGPDAADAGGKTSGATEGVSIAAGDRSPRTTTGGRRLTSTPIVAGRCRWIVGRSGKRGVDDGHGETVCPPVAVAWPRRPDARSVGGRGAESPLPLSPDA